MSYPQHAARSMNLWSRFCRGIFFFLILFFFFAFLLLCFWPSLLLSTIYNQSRTSLCITPHTATSDQLWEQNVCLKWNCWKWACTCSLCLFLWDCHAMWLCADAGALSACPLLTGSRCCCHEDTAHAVLSAHTKPVTGLSCKFKSIKCWLACEDIRIYCILGKQM